MQNPEDVRVEGDRVVVPLDLRLGDGLPYRLYAVDLTDDEILATNRFRGTWGPPCSVGADPSRELPSAALPTKTRRRRGWRLLKEGVLQEPRMVVRTTPGLRYAFVVDTGTDAVVSPVFGHRPELERVLPGSRSSPVARIRGVVIDEAGDPIANVRLTIHDDATPSFDASRWRLDVLAIRTEERSLDDVLRTASDGTFAIDLRYQLAPAIRADHRGYASRTIRVERTDEHGYMAQPIRIVLSSRVRP
ncbi:MAG: hypothetical protein RIT81_11430 [Deltaproteobacteria bacterium]